MARTKFVASTVGTQYRRQPKPGTLVEIVFSKLTRTHNYQDVLPELLDAVVAANKLGQRVVAIVDGSICGDSAVDISNITINGVQTTLGHSGMRFDRTKHSQTVALRDLYRTTRQKGDPTAQ